MPQFNPSPIPEYGLRPTDTGAPLPVPLPTNIFAPTQQQGGVRTGQAYGGIIYDSAAAGNQVSSLSPSSGLFPGPTNLPGTGVGATTTFSLPTDFRRGASNGIIPSLTGFQCYLNVIGTYQDSATVTWRLEHLVGATATTLASGATVGVSLSGRGTLSATTLYRAWFTVNFPPVDIDPLWLNDSFRLTTQTGMGASDISRVRVMAGIADSGIDFFGNQYRSVAVRTPASNVSVLDDSSLYWLSAPNPSKFAVEALYFDVRNAGAQVVVDRVTIDPLTPGMYAYIYYSNDVQGPGVDSASWDNLLWNPVYKPLQLTNSQTYVFPEPIHAKYIKVEFSNLQPKSYNPGPFQAPTRYRKHPSWVLNYFLTVFASQELDLLSSQVAVTYDALDLAYSYHTEDIVQRPAASALANFPTTQTVNQADPRTLAKIGLDFQQFGTQPAKSGDGQSILGRFGATQPFTDYSVEEVQTGVGNTSVVSNLNRESLLVEKGFPFMFFYLPCRHMYRVAEAIFEKNVAYFAGVRNIVFHRDIYTLSDDTPQYNETLADANNSLINDLYDPVALPMN